MKIQKLSSQCTICRNENRFKIQKAIDSGMTMKEISNVYNVTERALLNHNQKNHRISLLATGYIDLKVRQEALDIGAILTRYIRKWIENLENRDPAEIKDADVLKAIAELNKLRGEIINKHEVVIDSKTVSSALKDFLDEN